MSTSNPSTLTKKYPRSILMNRNRDQSRLDTSTNSANSENLVQNSLVDESQINSTFNYTVDYQHIQQPTTFLSVAPSNQPIYESQITFNPLTGQHEQQIVTCEQYYSNLNAKEYSGCLSSLFSYDFKLSIDSNWRRKLLILIVIVNALMTIINAAIIIWIMSFYYLSMNGVIDFKSNEKITLRGDAHFEKSIQLNSLSSIEDEQLRIRSNNIIAQDLRTQAFLSMNIVPGHIVGQADKFVLNDQENNTRMMINGSQFFSSSDKITINNDRQLNLGKSIQTKQLTSQTNLNILSLNRRVLIEASGLINLKSKNKLNLINNSTDRLQLITRAGRVYLNSSSIEFASLNSFVPSSTGKAYPDIYQLCICTNGKLFTDLADGHCYLDRSICQGT